MNLLKPCPFCGSKAELDFAGHSFDYISSNGEEKFIGFFYTVRCKDAFCKCRIGIYEDPHMAIDTWNQRKREEVC